MAKTKPIGVRFDEDLLKALEEDEIAKTAQQALNFLTEFYRDNCPKINFTEKFKDLILKKRTEEPKGIIETIKENAAIIIVDKDYNTEVFENKKAFDNSEIEKQIASVKAEIKPGFVDKGKFEKYQEKKIYELKKQLK